MDLYRGPFFLHYASIELEYKHPPGSSSSVPHVRLNLNIIHTKWQQNVRVDTQIQMNFTGMVSSVLHLQCLSAMKPLMEKV